MKTRIEDLALFGGEPAFREPLHVGRPNIGDRARLTGRFNRILDSRWLTNAGPFVREFEEKIAEITGAKHCIAMCNGAVALEIAIRALGMEDEVLVPSFTFIATAHALQWQAIRPVFCDIDPVTHNVDPADVERKITPRTTGIIGVHVWGNPCAVEALQAIAARHRLKLLYDAAHAFGCSHGGQMVGNFGDAEVYSFHATKFINAFEGGAVVTNHDELATRIRQMKNFGFIGYDNVVYVGTNGKMSEISGAMGTTSIESMDDFIAVNRRNYARYRAAMADVPGLRFIECSLAERRNFQYVVLEVDAARYGLSRDRLLKILHAENVLARRYFYPGCHRMQPYRTLYPDAGATLPMTAQACDQVLVLPTGTSMSEDTIDAVCAIMRLAHNHAERLAAGSPDST